MNKKIVTLILVMLVSFSFLSIVVADNTTHGDINGADDGSSDTPDKTDDGSSDKDDAADKKTDDDKKSDKDKTDDKDKSDDKSKKNYILAKGHGNNIKFSDGFRGFILDYSKSPASNGDEFKHVSASKAPNASDYFAYKVSFRTIDHVIVQVNQTNETNETGPESFTNNTTVPTTALNQTKGNETNGTFLDGLQGYFDSILNSVYDAWKPIIDSITGFALSVMGGIEWIRNMFNGFMDQIQQLIDGLDRLIELLGSIWEELSGFLKMFAILLTSIEQLLHLILSALDFIIGLLQTLISLVQYIIGLILSIINFIMGIINQIIGMISELINSIIAFITDLINQLTALINAILDFLKKAGSYLVNVIANASIILCSFIVITVATFVYGKSR